jgi:hypothetical protein
VIVTLSLALFLAVQPFANTSAAVPPTPLEAGYRQMYDLDFDRAHRTFRQWAELHPEDPMAPVSDAAAYLFAEFDRLHILESEFFLHDDAFLNRTKPVPDAQLKQSFDADLAKSKQLADAALVRDPHNQNAEFATLLRLGLHSDYLALIEKRYLASLNDVKASRALAERLIAADPGFSDAYLAIGVENYLLSLKPAPLRLLLRLGGAQTDKDRGIQNLSLTAEHGHYLLPYARVLLAVAALRDKNIARAKELLQGLANEFPHNRLYVQELSRLR